MLDDEGYILLKNKFPLNELKSDFVLPNKKIDYRLLKRFVDKVFFPKISVTPYYGKLRFSNNTNSKDAAVFHGDTYNHTDENQIDVYTCLLYFDEAEMEIIPKTHKKDYVKTKSATELFNSKIKILIEPGDILIFHSNLHHRGVSYNKKLNNGEIKSRRLLQVFDVCFSKEDRDKYFNKLVVLMTGSSIPVKIQNKLTGDSEGPGSYLSFMNYYLVRHDMQYKTLLIDISNCEKKGKIVSYEPGDRMIYSEMEKSKNFIGKENVNVVFDDLLAKNSKGISNFKLLLLLFVIFCIILYFNK